MLHMWKKIKKLNKEKNYRTVRQLSLYCKKILLFVFDSGITTKSHF